MPSGDPHRTVDLYRIAVEGMMDDGLPLEEVERSIDATELSPDEKAALWLLAWSLEEPRSERARWPTHLQLVATHPVLELGGEKNE